jgi:hypothetical protein
MQCQPADIVGRQVPGWRDLGLEPKRVYKLLRDAEALKEAAPTFAGVPLLDKHVPCDSVQHHPEAIVGCVGEVTWRAPFLIAAITVWVQSAIDAIEDRSRSDLSAGYALARAEHLVAVSADAVVRAEAPRVLAESVAAAATLARCRLLLRYMQRPALGGFPIAVSRQVRDGEAFVGEVAAAVARHLETGLQTIVDTERNWSRNQLLAPWIECRNALLSGDSDAALPQ